MKIGLEQKRSESEAYPTGPGTTLLETEGVVDDKGFNGVSISLDQFCSKDWTIKL